MEIAILRFDAPLMSFGGVMVDQNGFTDRFPGTSLLAGLFANAMGMSHGEAGALGALQERIEYAARWDVAPASIVDYQTVNLGSGKMRGTDGRPAANRGTGPAKIDSALTSVFGTTSRMGS